MCSKDGAELQMEGQTVLLEEADAWLVLRRAGHCYHILETVTAIEATAPSAAVHAGNEHTLAVFRLLHSHMGGSG